MRKGPLTIDSLDRPNAPNPNIPKNTGTDYKGLAMIFGVISTAIIILWLAGLGITTLMEYYTARVIILWIPFGIIGLAALATTIYWIRKIIIFDGLENNTSIFALSKNKDFIKEVATEYAKASATAFHQNVTYGDNTNNTNSTALMNSETPDRGDGTTILMSDLLDKINGNNK